jgi:hypothetical protein
MSATDDVVGPEDAPAGYTRDRNSRWHRFGILPSGVRYPALVQSTSSSRKNPRVISSFSAAPMLRSLR